MTRRQFFGGAGGLAAAGVAYATVLEPRWLDTTETRVQLVRGGQHTIRILQLTDLHASWAVPMSMIGTAIATGLAKKPDLICLTGDFITHGFEVDIAAYALELKKLSAVAPTFAVLGNHDGGLWASYRSGYADHSAVDKLLQDSGIELLHNRCMQPQIRGRELNLVGVGDLWAQEIDADLAFSATKKDIPAVLLSHNPDSKTVLSRFRWDLMLSGHTHGGQVMIPFEGPRYAPVQDKRFVAGLHEWESRQIYVSRGVGNLGSVRFRCRPEVTLLDLVVA